jgi:predicted membrane-bound dolichyl-phosphate-mannose-protein mannosyltransferase
MTSQPPKSPWKKAASSAILAWLAIAALSFVCGLIIEAVDAFGRSEPTHFLVAGAIIGAIGALLFGVPLALLTGILRWLTDR